MLSAVLPYFFVLWIHCLHTILQHTGMNFKDMKHKFIALHVTSLELNLFQLSVGYSGKRSRAIYYPPNKSLLFSKWSPHNITLKLYLVSSLPSKCNTLGPHIQWWTCRYAHSQVMWHGHSRNTILLRAVDKQSVGLC